MSQLPKDLMVPLLLNYKTKQHYLVFEKNLVVLVHFLKLSLYLYLTPFMFSQVKLFSNDLVIVNFLLLNVLIFIIEKKMHRHGPP